MNNHIVDTTLNLSDRDDREFYRSANADITDEQILEMVWKVYHYLEDFKNNGIVADRKTLISIVRTYLIPKG
jgi:hypothetical protein